MTELTLSRLQADYVLELQLRRLTALAYDELVEEMVTLAETIADLQKILESEQRQRTIVIRELGEIVEKYGAPRRTRIIGVNEVPDLTELEVAAVADLPDDPCVVSLTASGIVGREPRGTAKSYTPSRHDVIVAVAVTTLPSKVHALTSAGRLLSMTAIDVPEVGGRSRGREAGEVFGADRGETIVSIVTTTADGSPGAPLLLVTAQGMAKRLEPGALDDLPSGRPVIKLAERDRLVAAVACQESDEVVMITSDAQALRTPVQTISTQGPAAKGVAGMALKGNARIVGAGLAAPGVVVITITDTGSAKSTSVDEVPAKGRGGGGVRLTKFKNEQRIDYAWIGVPDRIVAVVGQVDAPTKPDNTPESIAMRPTRRDGTSSTTTRRILQIGTLRW